MIKYIKEDTKATRNEIAKMKEKDKSANESTRRKIQELKGLWKSKN